MNKNLTITQSTQIKAEISKVWDALINPEKIKIYLFGTEVLTDWKKGSSIFFQGEYDGHKYKDGGTIIDIKPEKLLQYTYWSSFSGMEDKEENYSVVTYKLKQEDNYILLTVSQQGFANEEAQKHSKQNWEMVLDKIKEMSIA